VKAEISLGHPGEATEAHMKSLRNSPVNAGARHAVTHLACLSTRSAHESSRHTHRNLLIAAIRPLQLVPNRLRALFLFALLLTPSSIAGLQAQASQKNTEQPASAAGKIYRKASPAVVLIQDYNDKGEVSASGSGFLISSDGRILTNFHVIRHTRRATVRLTNGDAYDDVQVLDVDKRKDIAILKIKAVDLPFLTLGRAGAVEVGDAVYTLSTPLGVLQNTLSDGIVSGIRAFDGFKYFQLTAPISHGSSGAPIFDANGEVIGIAVSTVAAGQNLNFAIPIDYAKGMLASDQPQPLSAFYEPETQQPTDVAKSIPASGTPGSATTVDAGVDEMKRQGVGVYFEKQIGKWTEQDAEGLLGKPHGHRYGVGDPMPELWGFDDPTRKFREIELLFDGSTRKLHDIFIYPYSVSWNDCTRKWGDNAKVVATNKDGVQVFNYSDRRLMVVVDASEKVIKFGIY
jgi:hypothetical protein